jgi:hypothetical protein
VLVCPETRPWHRLGAKSGKCAPGRVPSKGTTALCAFRIPEFVGSNRSAFTLLGCVENGERQRCQSQLLAASEEREEPMSESPTDRELLLEILWRLGRIEGISESWATGRGLETQTVRRSRAVNRGP